MICPSEKGSSSSAASGLGDMVAGSNEKRATKMRTSLSLTFGELTPPVDRQTHQTIQKPDDL